MVTRGYSHIGVNLHNDSSKVNIALYNIIIPIQSFALLISGSSMGGTKPSLRGQFWRRKIQQLCHHHSNSVQPQLRPLRPHQDWAPWAHVINICSWKYIFSAWNVVSLPQNLSNLRWTHPSKNTMFYWTVLGVDYYLTAPTNQCSFSSAHYGHIRTEPLARMWWIHRYMLRWKYIFPAWNDFVLLLVMLTSESL